MRLSRRSTALLALTAILAFPGAAHAVCPQSSLLEEEQEAGVILVGVAQPGATDPSGNLVSPARFRVLRYEKGSGRSTVRVTTGTRRTTTPSGEPGYVRVSNGFFPRAGRTYRILGRARKGRIQTDACDGTRAVPRRAPRFTVRAGLGSARRLPVTDFRGRRRRGGLPVIRAPRGRVLGLGPGFVGADTVLTRAGSFRAFGERYGNGWRLPRRLRARETIVVHTGLALYAFTVVRR